MDDIPFSRLTGLRIYHVAGLRSELQDNAGSDQVIFYTSGGDFELLHERDCCESVTLYDIVGDPADLEDAICARASLDTNTSDPYPKEHPDSYTWSYYNIQTHKGHVQLRWLGESNGYYGETVAFRKINDKTAYKPLTYRAGGDV